MASNVMRKVSMRSLASHKLRLVLTVFSVVLGTSFVAGAVIFTSTVSNAFNSIFDNVAKGVAVEINAVGEGPGVPVVMVDDLRKNQKELGIERLAVDNSGPVTLADASGRAIQSGGAPSIGMSYLPPDQAVGEESTIISGRAPERAGEIALNSEAASKGDLKIGSKTKLVVGAGLAKPMEVTVVGITEMPSSSGGFIGVMFDKDTAAKLFSDGKYVATVGLAARAGVTDVQLRDAVQAHLEGVLKAQDPKIDFDEVYQVRTGDQVREDAKANIDQFLTIFRAILLAFAAIGLLVGTFIIYNTFSMIVAQRNRELALLRAIGASRQNVSRSVLLEALIVGVIGGVLGLALGIGIAAAMVAFTEAQGVPSDGLQVGVAAIAAAVFVGIVVTLLSAWIPARRASRIPPVEAMRESTVEPGAGSLRVRTLVGAIFGVLGVVALVVGGLGEGTGPALIVGLGALLAIVAVVLAAPMISRPVVGAFGAVFEKPFGTVGKLARTNAVRNPRRTAATAFALTLGLMLVVIIGTLGWSFKGTVDSAVDKGLRADFVVTGNNNMPLPLSVVDYVKDAPGAGEVVAQAYGAAKYDGRDEYLSSPYGGAIGDVAAITMIEGTDDLPGDGLLISNTVARDNGWKLGQEVTFTSTGGEEVPTRVTGVFEANEAIAGTMVGWETYEQLMPVAMKRISGPVLVVAKPGVSTEELRTQLEDATAEFLTAQVLDRDQFKNSISSQIDQMMVTLYALLGLSLIIAVLGIINTLALSVVERKQEIGMLRAVGMSRGQVRRTIYLESTYIAVFGALLGTVLGLAIGVPLVRTLAHWGLEGVVIPWALIGVTLVGSAVVGVIAALWPAVTAARTRPLEAITSE
ncbi:ABC transporter permease [Gordonia sp. (in: high G+C Gram-positive bacteria)]|uniref:ABC transporter permease n=1 Tax=Gordonia sp. (in: high G+C Gram-positive bacteria) TaxID=84139 RepID=UPI00168EDF4A|nr:ABC transporter permease [Gordonia sp. (in: high G+C Gram-positive bacteria)]NLG48200.1 ABC transporter permease [Gordonia sp. (in: high G+C Gram-positive bacteria)]